MAVIGAVLLLRIVTLNEDHERVEAVSGASWLTQRRSSLILWWIWGLFGLVAMAPLAGWIADVVSLGIAFLLGSVMLGLAAFCIALSPAPAHPARPHPILAATLAVEEEPEEFTRVTPPVYRISARDLRAILSDGTAVLILLFMLLLGMAAAVNPTILYWYFLELGSTRLMLGASVSTWLVMAPLILLLSGWLWRRCGHRYIFIIGLLLYSIRFLGKLILVPIFN
jgi:Na+/melibiose symporter-like transporter